MAHGLNSVIKRGVGAVQCKSESKTGVGSRRIFPPQFKLQVLDSYRNDADCKGNQRATARKYGIHRRQIQKWLQVENTLRSSGAGGKPQSTQTVKSEMSLNGHRQLDDESSALRSASLASESRVPALEPPAGWRPQQAPLCVVLPDPPAVPMDLSLKRPVTTPLSSPHRSAPSYSPSSLPSQHADVWDLSTKSNKRKAEEDGASPKPVKLFKPYLDDLKDKDCSVTPPSPQQAPYCYQPPLTHSPEIYYVNNNNLCCDLKSPEYHSPYTLHELQPRTSPFYSYAYYPDYHPSELSPSYCPYEDYPTLLHPLPLKQRQSYSLDFKLSAIDYFHDNHKGNPKLLTKYHAPARDLSKCKKQDDVQPKYESVKEMHAVR